MSTAIVFGLTTISVLAVVVATLIAVPVVDSLEERALLKARLRDQTWRD